jgi:hypothetical protein
LRVDLLEPLYEKPFKWRITLMTDSTTRHYYIDEAGDGTIFNSMPEAMLKRG